MRNFLLLTLGAILLAINLNLFLVPAQLAPGGVSGSAIILHHYFPALPVGGLMLLLNLPLLLVGFRVLGRYQFLWRTVYTVLLYNLGADVLARFTPPGGIAHDPLLNAVYAGVLGGIGAGLVYRGGGTPGGTGILGRALQLRTGMPVSQIYLLTDGAVVFVAGLVFGWEKALLALLTLFVWGIVTDYVLEGPSVVRTAFVVTDHPEEVARAVTRELGLGLTAWSGRGMFTDVEHTVLFCAVSRPDVDTLRAAVSRADPAAFMVIGHGHQASGGVYRSGMKRGA